MSPREAPPGSPRAGSRRGSGRGAAPGVPAALGKLASACGVQLAYRDVGGGRRTASRESLLAVLRALGVEIESAGEAPDALRRLRRHRRERVVEPVVVARREEGGETRLCVPEEGGAPVCRLRLEAGGTRELGAPGASEAGEDPFPVVGSERVEGRRYVERRLALPSGLPHGYHRLVVENGSSRGEALVICAPARAWHPPGRGAGRDRRWGVFAPTYALRSGRPGGAGDPDGGTSAAERGGEAAAADPGAGDLGDLRRLVRWTSRRGGDYAGTLPLLAAFLDEPFEPSPYAPVSRLFWNELYLEPERLPGWGELELEPGGGGDAGRVDYRGVMRRKRRRLEALSKRFFTSGGGSTTSFRRFLDEHPRAEAYARFRAVVERRRAAWPAWPERSREGDLREEDHDPAARRYHLFVQWAADRQMRALADEGRERGTDLYLDLPLGSHPAGFDVWRERDAFARGAAVGAPPDDFFREGQNWGFPPPHPARMRERGYAYEIDSVRHSLASAGLLRIDHVMALHRLFWVPAGRPATEGAYVRYRPEERHAILCLESHREETRLVGEDLGTVPGEVRRTMATRGVDRMFVVQMELRAESPALRPPPRRSLAGLNTHDMHPFAGFWTERDVEARVDTGLLEPDEADGERDRRRRLRESLVRFLREEGHLPEGEGLPSERAVREACLAWLAAGPARTVMLNLEDLWGEPRAQNLPGTAGEGNWRRRATLTMEEMEESEAIDRVLERVRTHRDRSG